MYLHRNLHRLQMEPVKSQLVASGRIGGSRSHCIYSMDPLLKINDACAVSHYVKSVPKLFCSVPVCLMFCVAKITFKIGQWKQSELNLFVSFRILISLRQINRNLISHPRENNTFMNISHL